MKNRVTIADVASSAGVSIASVSRVLTNSRKVTPRIRVAVSEAAAELDYRPDYIARALRRQLTGTIGMVVPHVTNPFYASLVQGIEIVLHQSRGVPLLGDSRGDPDLEIRKVHSLLDRRIDGLIIIPADEHASLGIIEEAAENVPVVQLDSMVEGFRGDFVGIDNRDGIKKLICHLLSLGRTDLAFIGGRRAASPGAERLRAFIELAPEAKPDGAQRVLVGDGQLEWGKGAADALIEWGSASARTLVRSGMIPEAVVCANDLIAIGVLRGLASEGIAVPGDVLVTGFDDIRYATICSPQLTSIRQPVDELSKRAVEILEARIRSREGGPRIERVQAELVVRGSTCADLPFRDTVGELLAE